MRNNIHISLCSILLVLMCTELSAQRFGAAILAGPSLTQIQGDNLAGYENVAFSAGIKGSTYINSRWNVNIELLFAQKGSRDGLFKDDVLPRQGMDLNYIEVPVYVEIKDWEVESQNQGAYSKVSAHAGLSYGRIISSNVIELPNLTVGDIRNDDLSYLIGLRFQWNRRWAISGRYSRSILSIGMVEADNSDLTNELYPYSLNFRLEYVL